MAQNNSNPMNQGTTIPDWSREIRYPDVPSRHVTVTNIPAETNPNHVTYQEIRGDSLNSTPRMGGTLDMRNPLGQEATIAITARIA